MGKRYVYLTTRSADCNCKGIRWIKSSKQCYLLKSLTGQVNTDANWRRSQKTRWLTSQASPEEKVGHIGGTNIATSTYPGCKQDCDNNADCDGVRWIVASNACYLLSSMPSKTSSTDGNWRHMHRPQWRSYTNCSDADPQGQLGSDGNAFCRSRATMD